MVKGLAFFLIFGLLLWNQISLGNDIDVDDEEVEAEEEIDPDSITDHNHRLYDNSKDELINKTSVGIEDGTKYTEFRRNRITGEIYPYEYIYRAAKPYNPRTELGQDFNSSIFTVDGIQFDQLITTNQHVLVYVRKHLGMPGSTSRQFYEIGKRVKKENLPVKLIRICPPYFQNFNDSKYSLNMPSLVLFKNYGEEELIYEEPLDVSKRNVEYVYEWMVSRLGSIYKLLLTKEDVDSFMKNNTLSVVAYFKEFNETAIKVYDKAIQYIEGPAYGLIVDKNASELFEAKYKYDIKVYHKNGEKVYPLFLPNTTNIDDQFEINHIIERLVIYKNPPVVELIPSELPTLESSFIKYDLFMFINGGDPDRKEILDIFTRVAEKFREDVKCFLIDYSNKDNEVLANERGVRIAPGYKRQRLVMNEKRDKFKKYRPEPDFWEDGGMEQEDDKTQGLMKEEDIEAFIRSVLENKAKRFYLTEKVAKEEDDIIIEEAEKNPYGTPKVVKKLIGKTWEKFCKDPDMTSVVYFTAGWCMGCNHTIHTRLTRLGLHYGRKGRTDIQFGYSDYSLNEYPGIKNETVPRLKIFPKGTDDEIAMEGDEKYCNVKQFIETNGKDSKCDPNTPRDPENIDVNKKWVSTKINHNDDEDDDKEDVHEEL